MSAETGKVRFKYIFDVVIVSPGKPHTITFAFPSVPLVPAAPAGPRGPSGPSHEAAIIPITKRTIAKLFRFFITV